jgi:hypothetical protein
LLFPLPYTALYALFCSRASFSRFFSAFLSLICLW